MSFYINNVKVAWREIVLILNNFMQLVRKNSLFYNTADIPNGLPEGTRIIIYYSTKHQPEKEGLTYFKRSTY